MLIGRLADQSWSTEVCTTVSSSSTGVAIQPATRWGPRCPECYARSFGLASFVLPGLMTRFHLCPRGQRYSIIQTGGAFNLLRSRYFTVTALRLHFGHS
jgi:hypothetical protein